MPFSLFRGFGKVIAIRSKRPENQGRTQHGLATADHEGSKPGFQELPTGFPSTPYPWGASPTHEARDIAQLALSLFQPFTGVIPLAGTPINAAIGGLLGILKVIDTCGQNRAALDDLTSRLYRLCCHLCNAPPALDPLEHSRRDLLARKLQDTSTRLKKLQKRRLAYTSVTQALTGCSTDINNYLIECLWSSQMQSQRETRELLIISRRREEGLQSFETSSASHLARTVALGCVTLVDATGHQHSISVDWCTSYQQLNSMLRLLFERDKMEAQIQRRYIEEGKYDLCIDRGTQVTPLTCQEWSSIEPGTKIVMRVTIVQKTRSLTEVDYRCHFCGAVNHLDISSVKFENRERAVRSTDCRECQRRFQITRAGINRRSARPSNSDSNQTTSAEMRLIRNFHVEQIDWLLWDLWRDYWRDLLIEKENVSF